MKHLGLVLVSVGLAAVAILVFLVIGDGGGSGGSAVTPIASVPGAGRPADLAAVDGADAVPGGRAPVSAGSAEPAALGDPAAGAITGAGGRALAGTVVAPAAASLAGVLVGAYPSRQAGLEALGSLFDHVDAAASGGESGPDDRPLAAALTGPDGRFELALPPGHDTVVLAAVGDMLWSPVPVEARVGEAEPRLLCQQGARIDGTVIPPAGAEDADLAGIEVRLGVSLATGPRIGTGGAPGRETTTNQRGEFAFPAVVTTADQRVRALPEAFAAAAAPVADLRPGERRTVFIDLAPGRTIGGTVYAEEGGPIAGATVAIEERTGFGTGGATLRETESDAEGRFELRHMPAEAVRGRASARGYLRQGFDVAALIDAEDEVVVELSRGARIAGKLSLPDGSPAGGAAVEARIDIARANDSNQADLWRSQGADGEADGDGVFELVGLSGSAFVVDVRLELAEGDPRIDDLGGRHFWARAEGVEPTEALDLVLAPASLLIGRVVDAEGLPVREFSIRADRPTSTPWMQLEGAETFWFQNDDGRFEIADLIDDRWSIDARAPGYAPSEPVEVTLPVEGELLFELADGVAVVGRVVDPAGRPVLGASVAPDQNWFAALRQADSRRATSLDDGSFRLEDLAPGEVTLEAIHADFATSETVTVELPEEGELTGVELVLRQGGGVRGTVYDADGEPLSGAQIFCQLTKTFEPTISTSDNDGHFEFSLLAPGTYQVVSMGNVGGLFDGSDRDGSTAELLSGMKLALAEVVDGETVEVVLGAPPADPVRVSGTVTGAGEPVTQGMVTFVREASGLETMKLAALGEEGRYDVVLDEPGSFLVTVQAGGSGMSLRQANVEFRIDVPKGDEFELDLELPTAGIQGVVRGIDGAPLAGQLISATREEGVLYGTAYGGGFGTTTTEADGSYAFAHLHPGRYLVTAGGSFFGVQLGNGDARGRGVRGGVLVAEGSVTYGIDFELGPPVTVLGVVESADGTPVEGASVFVRDANGQPIERFSLISTGSDGTFRFDGLAPGEYTFSARTTELASVESEPVRVAPDDPPRVVLVVEPGTTIIARVDVDGEPSLDTRLQVVDDSGRDVSGMIGFNDLMEAFQSGFESGEYRVGPVPPGHYRLTVTAPDGREESKTVTVGGTPERRVRLRIR